MGDLADQEQIRSRGCQAWNLGWRKERFMWENHLVEQLLATISKVQWNMEGHDRLVWVGNN